MSRVFKITQLKRNIVSGSIVHGLNILVAFISYPIFIRFLGFELFSVWTLLSVIISFAQMGDFGIGKAVIYYVSIANTDHNVLRIKSILLNSALLLILFSIILQSFLWIFNTEIAGFLAVPDAYYDQSVIVIPLIGISVFTFLIYDCLSGAISGLGRIDISNSVLLLLNVTKVILSVVFLYFNPNLYSMVFAVLLSNAIFIIIMLFILTNKKYLRTSKFPKVSINVFKELIQYGKSIFGIQVLNILMFPVIKVVISHVYGVSFVGFFELATKAAYSIRTLFERGLFALMPEFAKSAKSFNYDLTVKTELKNKVKKITKKLIYFGVPFFFGVAVISKYLLKLWLGNDFNQEILYGYILLQPGIIVGLIALPAYYALMAIKRQEICFHEALIRLLIVSLLLTALLGGIDFIFVFVFISIAVVFSNGYVVFVFFKRS